MRADHPRTHGHWERCGARAPWSSKIVRQRPWHCEAASFRVFPLNLGAITLAVAGAFQASLRRSTAFWEGRSLGRK